MSLFVRQHSIISSIGGLPTRKIEQCSKILFGKKPNETLYRFIGGFVDRSDVSWEHAAKREFMEESGGCEIGDLRYVASSKINDWRYANSESGIMTTLFLGKFMWGKVTPSDDIASLTWVKPEDIDVDTDIHDFPPEILQAVLKIDQVRSFIKQAHQIITAGREPCIFCGLPIDKSGHLCPRANGYKR